MLNYNKNLKQVSQKLSGSMADAELLLWSKLKGKQAKRLLFSRQKTFKGSPGSKELKAKPYTIAGTTFLCG